MADHNNETISTTTVVNSTGNWNSTTITGGGLELCVSGANAYDTTVTNNTYLWLQDAAYASGVSVGGGSARATVYRSNATIENIHIDSGVIIRDSARLKVSAGGRVLNANVSGAYVGIYTNGYMSKVSLDSTACLWLPNAGAVLENIHIDSGTNAVGTPRLDVRAGATVRGAVVSGAYVQVTGGSTAKVYDVVLDSSAQMRVYNYATGSGVTLSHTGCDLKVYQNNASVTDLTVLAGIASAYQTGKITNAVIGDRLHVSSTGYASGVQLLSHGTAYINGSGALIENVHINSGGSNKAAYPNLDIRLGSANGVVASGAGIQVTGASASISGVVMEENATMVVYNYAAAQGVTVNSGTFSLYSAATAVGVTANNGGVFNVSNAASVDTATVTNGGRMLVNATGNATNVTVSAGGQLNNFLWDYDLSIAAIVNGTATIAPNVVMEVNKLHVREGGSASGTTVSAGLVNVSNGGVFTNGVLRGTNTGGGTAADYVIVYAGGKISDTVIHSARVDVSAGASGENLVVSGGYGVVVRGATATNVSAVGTAAANYVFIQSNSILHGGYFTGKGELRFDGGCSATDIVFENGGAAIVGTNAWTSNVTLRGAATNINFAGTVFDATVSGGALNFSSGTLTNLTVSAGAANVSSGGVVNNLALSAGNAKVFEAGSVNGADVKSGANLYASKGTVENVTVEKGGNLFVRDGGYASGVSGNGYVDVYTGTISSAVMTNGSSFRVYNPGYAENVWIDNTEVVVRYAGAVLSKAYISGGKTTSIQSDGIARELTQSTGRLRLDGNLAGTVSGATLTGVWTEVFSHGVISGYSATAGSTYIYSGGQLLNGTAFAGNSIYISGGEASDITINSGARLSAMSGGALQDLVVRGGYAELLTGATLDGATVVREGAAGDLRVYNGYATNVDVAGNAAQIVIRFNTASGSNITASAGAYLQVQNAAVASNVTVSGARLILGMAPSTTGNAGSVYGANLTSARVDIASGGLVSGFTAEAGSMFISSGAKIENGSAKGGAITLNAGAQMVDVAATDGATINITDQYKASATIVGSRTAFDEGALTYSGVAVAGAAKDGVISGLNASGEEFRLGIGDGIVIKDAVLDNTNTRISAFGGAVVSGATIYNGGLICNGGCDARIYDVTISRAGEGDCTLNLSGTAQAFNTVVDGGTLSVNTAGAKIENTILKAGGTVNIAAGADTGASFTLAFDGAEATMGVSLTQIAASTTVYATGVEAVGTYTLGTGSREGVTQKWGLYENALANGGTYDDALNGVTYSFNGTAITTTALSIATGEAAGLTGGNYTALRTTDRAAKWTSGAGATLVTENFNGDAWVEVAGDVTGAIYGASTAFANTVNIDAKSGTIRNLAAGATAGGTVGAVKLTFDGADLAGAGYAGGFGNVTGDTETLIETGSFAKDFYAGALANKLDAATSVDDVVLTVNGGSFSGNIYGASAVKTTASATDTRHTAENVTLTVTDGETTKGAQACIFAGGYATGSTANVKVYTVTSVTAEIAGGSWGTACGGRGVFGGVMASGVTAEAGDVNLTISGGSMGNVYGGGWAQKGGTSVAGDVEITITGGTIANVFGGGTHSVEGAKGTTSVDSVSINVSGGTISGDIYARGQLDGDSVTGDVVVNFTGGSNFGCGVWGYSYVGGEDPSAAALSFSAYTGTFSGKIGGFAGIVIDDDSAMTLTTAAADVSNSAWEFDLTDRDAELAGTSLLTWSGADFAGDSVKVAFADAEQAAAGWSIAAADFTGATFDLYIGGSEIASVAYNTAISGGAWDGWKFTDVDGTLKFAKIA